MCISDICLQAGEVAQQFRALVALAEELGQFQTLAWQLTDIQNSSSGGPDALFSSEGTRYIRLVPRLTCKQNA